MKKKLFWFLLVFFISVVSVFSQTWTIRPVKDTGIDIKYTVITEQQFDRLLKSHTVSGDYASLRYVDILEGLGGLLESNGSKVISGSAPILDGYFYLLSEWIPRTEDMRTAVLKTGMGISLLYGNTKTGLFMIAFGNIFAGPSLGIDFYPLDSNAFIQRYNGFIDLVNGNDE